MSQLLRIISKITAQKRAKNRYNIFLDDEYAFSVDQETFIKENLKKGKQLSEEDIARIQATENFQQAYLLAINYLSYRMRSVKEMQQYLQKKEIAPETIEMIIERLVKEKNLDNQAFAHSFVKDRVLLTSKGPTVIKQELYEKGIASSIIDQALAEFSTEAQYDKVYKFVEREVKKRTKHPHKKRMEQIRLTLMRRGFTNDIISAVVDEVEVDVDKNDEREKVMKEGEKIYRRYARKHEGYELRERCKAALYQKGFPMDLIMEFIENKKETD